MRRNLKSQIQKDNKRVFLNLDEFAEPVVIKYYRWGDTKPPDELHIDVVIGTDENMTKTWNAEKAYQIPSDIKSVKEENLTLYVAQEDWQPVPKRGRRLKLNGRDYEISSVTTNTGMLIINMHRLKG